MQTKTGFSGSLMQCLETKDAHKGLLLDKSLGEEAHCEVHVGTQNIHLLQLS